MPLALTINDDTNYYDDNQANEAMQAYWTAKRSGSDAELTRITNRPTEAPDDDEDPEPTPGGTVSAIAVARIKRHEEILLERGISLPPPVYAPGTPVVQLGHGNFRTSRQKWEDMPDIVDALAGVYEAVKSEEREDHLVYVNELHMHDDGRLDFGQGPVGVEGNGLRALISRNSDVFPRAGEYLASVDPELRAANFNRQIPHVDGDKMLNLRMRSVNGRRQLFAVTSPRYAAFDADQVAVALSGALLGSGMRGEVTYDPRTTNLVVNGLLHADEVVDLAAGDVFKVGVQFRSNDAAGGSIRGRGIAWRNLCLNLIIIGTGVTELLRRRHIGAVNEVMADVDRAARDSALLFKDFAEEWGALRTTKATSLFGVETMEDAFAELAGMKELQVGVKRDVVTELLLSNWQNEPGDTVADVINAVTSVHLLADIDDFQRARFEEAAGLLVPVLAARA